MSLPQKQRTRTPPPPPMGNTPVGSSSDTIEGLFSSLSSKVDEPLTLSEELLKNSTTKTNTIKQKLTELRSSVQTQNKAVDDLAQKTIDLEALTAKKTELDKEIAELKQSGTTSQEAIKKLENEKTKLESDVKTQINNIIKKVDGNKTSLTTNQTSISKLFGDLENEITTLQSSVKSKGSVSSASTPNSTSTFGPGTSTKQPIQVRGKKPVSSNKNKTGTYDAGPMRFGGKRRRTQRKRKNSRKKRTRKH